jgi:hypothetical protein
MVAGGICNTAKASTLERLRLGGVEVLGRMDDLRDFYARAGVVLNPVGPSTGIKIKSVEALVAGRDLVTTQWGADKSLETAFPGQIAVIEWPVEPAALAAVCVELLSRPANPSRPGGRRYMSNVGATVRSHLLA